VSTFLQHFESGAAALEGWNGLDHVHIMVNEQTGRAVALSVWADEESMRAATRERTRCAPACSERSGVKTDSVEHFRLVRTVQGPASKGMLPLIATGP
jgi:heme-degrading monooxygenase HmoA